MGNKRKPKLSKKQNANRLRKLAINMRKMKRAKLSSLEPTVIAKTDSQTLYSPEQHRELPVYIMNIDIPSSSPTNNCGRANLSSSEPTLIAKTDFKTLYSPEQHRELPVYIMNIDIPSSSTSNNCGRMKSAIENPTEASIEAETSRQAGNITMMETKEETETIGVEIPPAPPKDVECRACLQRFDYETDLLDIFQAWVPPWNGMGESIAQDLARLANVDITTEDSYSKLICQFCHQKLLEACSFIVNVRMNDWLLRQRAETLDGQGDTWPKPIQVDRIINNNVFNSAMDVEIKQEVLYDDETYPSRAEDTFKDGADVTDDTDNTFNKMEIKTEPEEIMQPKPFQMMVNANDISNVPGPIQYPYLDNNPCSNTSDNQYRNLRDNETIREQIQEHRDDTSNKLEKITANDMSDQKSEKASLRHNFKSRLDRLGNMSSVIEDHRTIMPYHLGLVATKALVVVVIVVSVEVLGAVEFHVPAEVLVPVEVARPRSCQTGGRNEHQ